MIYLHIWNLLSETQKSALLVHETIYAFLRDTGPNGIAVESNSVRTRRAVALLFSGVRFLSLDKLNITKEVNPVLCKTDDAFESERPGSLFYAYPNPNGKITFQFLTLLGRKLITRASIEGEKIDFSKCPLSLTDEPWHADAKLTSLMDSDFFVSIDWSPSSPKQNRILVTESDRNRSWETFSCEKQK